MLCVITRSIVVVLLVTSLFSALPPMVADTGLYFYKTWKDGEVKTCITYSGFPLLASCDNEQGDWKDSFDVLMVRDPSGTSHSERLRRSLIFESAHCKKFSVTFSQDPWPADATGFRMTIWRCILNKKKYSCDRFAGEP